MLRGDIRHCGTKGNGRKIRVIFVVPRAWGKSNDLIAHEHPSHMAMAISPTSASDIRYAVIELSPWTKMCGMIAIGDHFGREPYPHTGTACGRGSSFHAARRHFRACRPITLTTEHDPEMWLPVFPREKRGTRLRGDHAQTKGWARTAARFDARATGVGRRGVVVRGRRPIRKFNKKPAADSSARVLQFLR
jgi:hypothetical protein